MFKKRIYRSVALIALLTLMPLPARATWYGENIEKGSDIMMMDLRWPWWPENTYYACWNVSTSPANMGFYGGLGGTVETLEPDHRPNLDEKIQNACRPGGIWTLWGMGKTGEKSSPVSLGEYTYPKFTFGEGAAGGTASPVFPYIQCKRWYTMLIRVWQPIGVKNSKVSYVGRWIKDVQNNQWHLDAVLRFPDYVTSFDGNGGFLEDPSTGGRSSRSLHRRFGYCRKDGQWFKSDTIGYTALGKDTHWVVNVLPEDDHEYVAMELSSNKAMLPVLLKGACIPLDKPSYFKVKQPDTPTLDKPQVADVKAVSNREQVAISWTVPEHATPQLSYKVEVFNNADCKGSPIAMREEAIPSSRMVLLTASVANPTVRVSVTDIFDQVTKPVVVKATAAPNKSVASNVRAVNGLAYTFLIQDTLRHENYFYPKCKECPGNQQEQHYWSALAELENGKMVQSGVTFGINTDLRGTRTVGYGFKFNGLLNVPQDGLYVFHIQGYDGYCIKLDERDALLWDGLHGPTEQTVALNLAKGNHPLNIGYFVDFPKNGLAGYFKLEWEGPSLERQSIPASALLHVQTATEPQLTLTTKDGNMGAAIIKVKANPNGHTIKKIALYLGRLEIAEATADELVYEGALPTGTGTVWARMFYDEYCTLDSQSTNVSVKNVSLKEWNIGVAGDQTAPYGLTQATPDSLSFFGEGEYVVSKKVKGDFTMTCRVDSYSGKFNEPVNVLSWVGLTAREDASKNNWQWGSEFGVMQTSGYGLRTSAAHVDLGGGRFSEYTLPVNRPWLRIVRQGQMWSAWTSVDGKQWEHGSSHFKPAKEEVDAGVVFRAVREDTHAYYQAKVSQIKLELGVPKEMVLPTPIAAKNTGGERLTGVVVSISEPKVVVVRSSNLGLLRTVDGGQHWTTIGASSSETNCVRSVAIHPNNANIMLRACGNTEDNSLLSLTKDGGKTWQKLDFKGDFDGEGPSALCGEVVSFDPENPTTLYAGCETKGFFRSDDEGNTWKMTGIAGERITAVSVSRWVRGDKGQSFLFVCTCPDKWLLCLGRGNPLFPATVLKAHMYASTDGGIGWWPKNERNDLGYFNIAHVKTMPYDAATATSLGV